MSFILMIAPAAAWLAVSVIPLIYSRKKGHPKMGWAGFSWTFGGAVLCGGALGLIIAVWHIVFLRKLSQREETSDSQPPDAPDLWSKVKDIPAIKVSFILQGICIAIILVFKLNFGFGIVGAAIQYYLLAFWLNIRRIEAKVDMRELFGKAPADFSLISTLGALFAVVTCGFTAGVLNSPSTAITLSFDLGVALFFVTALFTPALEEIVFRGLMLQRLALRWSITKSIFATNLVFAMIHFSHMNGAAFFLGFVCSVLFFRTGTLLAPTIIHLVYNAIIYPLNLFYNASYFGNWKAAAPWMWLVAVLYLVVYLWRTWPRDTELPWVKREPSVVTITAESPQLSIKE